MCFSQCWHLLQMCSAITLRSWSSHFCGSWCGSDWVCVAFLKSICLFAPQEDPSGKIVALHVLLQNRDAWVCRMLARCLVLGSSWLLLMVVG